MDGATLQEKDNQQKERGAGDDVVVEGEDALGVGLAHQDVHGVGGAHLTHMLSNSHEYRLHEAGGTPWSVGGLKIGEIR